MTHYLIFIFIGLFTTSIFTNGQTNDCKIKIIKLQLDKNQIVKPGGVTDSLLKLAKLTSILLENSDIQKFDVKTDSACCNYFGQIYLTSHQYLLTSEAVSKLSTLDIPLCCGIPVAIYIDDKEIYRAMLWNVYSSFGNKSMTVSLVQSSLIITNQLPSIPDIRNNDLFRKILPKCLH
jgi:hypothetical protein